MCLEYFALIVIYSNDKGQIWYASCWVQSGVDFCTWPLWFQFRFAFIGMRSQGVCSNWSIASRSKPVSKVKSHAKLLEDVTLSINFLTNTVSIQANSNWLSAAPMTVSQSPFWMGVHCRTLRPPPPPGSRFIYSRVATRPNESRSRQLACQSRNRLNLARLLLLRSTSGHNRAASSSSHCSARQTRGPSSSAACLSACAK